MVVNQKNTHTIDYVYIVHLIGRAMIINRINGKKGFSLVGCNCYVSGVFAILETYATDHMNHLVKSSNYWHRASYFAYGLFHIRWKRNRKTASGIASFLSHWWHSNWIIVEKTEETLVLQPKQTHTPTVQINQNPIPVGISWNLDAITHTKYSANNSANKRTGGKKNSISIH